MTPVCVLSVLVTPPSNQVGEPAQLLAYYQYLPILPQTTALELITHGSYFLLQFLNL
jgi:hypothetical protein